MSVATVLDDEMRSQMVRERVERILEAEANDEPIQNGKQRDVDVSKNTHFEFVYGGDDDPEVAVYLERLHHDSGIEVMLWADEAWFPEDADDNAWGPDIPDGSALEQLGESLLDLVAGELGVDNTPKFEFHQRAPPSVVFSAVFYLD